MHAYPLAVRKLREHAEIWKRARYPYCDEFYALMRRLKEFEQTSTAISQILHRNIRLRYAQQVIIANLLDSSGTTLECRRRTPAPTSIS